MSIRLKRTTSSNDEFYPLNDEAISNGNKSGKNADAKVRSKLTQFSKNILKSTKNLAFNVVDTYSPNVREVKNSFKEAGIAAKEDFDKNFGGIISTAKKMIFGSNGEGIKKQLSTEIKDIKDRLKTGRIYTTAEDDMIESMNAQFGDLDSDDFSFGDDFDDSGSDSYSTVSEPDSLSAEPFSGVKKGRTRKVNVSSKQRRIKHASTRMHAPKPRVSKSTSGGIQAGDELVSGVTQSVGQNVISKQEEVWARTYEANKNNFERLYGYQNTIMKGVNSIVEFNNNVLSKNVQAQLEFQGKMIATQQDALAHFKEIKDAILVTSSYKTGERSRTLSSKIASNAVAFDGKSYWENVKRNLGDVAGTNSILSLFMAGPGMADMLSMSEDTGMKLINPVNALSSALVNGLISKTTRNKYRNFNDILSNFGGAFMGRMNMLRDYGKTDIASTIGKILGSRTTFVKESDNGMNENDLNAVVGWTGRSDRTLNEVIPRLLSKQLAALTGDEERSYDYKTGQFAKVSAINASYEKRKAMIFNDAEASTMMDSMSSAFAKTISENKALNKEYAGFDEVKIRNNIDKIRQNLIKAAKPFDINLIGDKRYYSVLVQGLPENEADRSVKMLIQLYNRMSSFEQIQWNNSITRVAANYQQSLNDVMRYNKVYGGTGAIAESQSSTQLKNIKRILDEDPAYKLTPEDTKAVKNRTPSATLTAKLQRRVTLLNEFETLNNTYGIYSPKDLKNTPSGLDIDYDLQKTMRAFSVNSYIANKTRNVGKQSLLEMINPFSGGSIVAQNNPIDKMYNTGIDAMSGVYKKFFGYGEGGEGINATLSYSQISLDQNENIINGLEEQKKKLRSFIKKHPGTVRADMAFKSIKLIDKQIKSLKSTRKKLEAGGVNTKFVNQDTSLGRFFGNLETIYDDFVNDNVISNGADSDKNANAAKTEAATFVKNTYKTAASSVDKVKKHVEDTWTASDKNIVSTVRILADELFEEGKYTANEAYDKAAETIKEKLDEHPEAKKAIKSGKAAFVKAKSSVNKAKKRTENKTQESLSKEENDELTNLVSQAERLAKTADIPISEAYDKVSEGFKDRLATMPKVAKRFKKFTDEANRKFKRVLFGSALPNNVDLGGTDYKKFGAKTGAIIGGTLGLFNGPLGAVTGSAVGAGAGALIGNKLNKSQFRTIRSPLVAMGYIDAATMKPKELYALASSIRGTKGIALRSLAEFELLRKTAYARPFGKVGEGLSKVGKTVVRGGRLALMTVKGTLPYKHLVDSLDQVLNTDKPSSEKISVYTMDKYMLYASINALSERNKKEKQVKAALMGTKEYKKLAGDVENGESWLHATVKEKITNIKRSVNRLRHFKYRYLINFLKGQGPEYENVEDLKDPNMIYALLDSFGQKKKNKKVFDVLKRSKAYMNLELAVKSKGLNREQRRELRQSLNRGHKIRRKFATIINLLNANNIPTTNDTSPKDIYADLIVLLDKKKKSNPELVNAIKRTSQYRELARAAGQKPEGASNTYIKQPSLFQKIFSGIKGIFGGSRVDFSSASNDLDYDLAKYNANVERKLQRAHRKGERLDETNADVVLDSIGTPTHKNLKDKLFNAGSIASGLLAKATSESSKKLFSKVKDRKEDNMAEAGKTAFSKTKNINTSILAATAAGIASISKSLSRTSKFLGQNDKGEVDEKNKETLAGMIHGWFKKVSDKKDSNGKDGFGKAGFLEKLLKLYGGSKSELAAGAIQTAGSALLIAGAIDNARKTSKISKEKGIGAAAGFATGLEMQNQNTEDWFQLDRGAKVKDVAKGMALGGTKQMLKSGSTFAKNVGKALTSKEARAAAKQELVGKSTKTIKDALTKFLQNPKIIKNIPKTALQGIRQLPEKIIAKFKTGLQGVKQIGKNYKNALKSVPVAGWAIAIADAVWSFASGANDAGAYFNVAPNDVTAGMRVTASLTNGIFSLLESALAITGIGAAIAIGLEIIVPKSWLIQTIYKICANKIDEAELKAKQKEQEDRAKSLGIDAKTLSRAENRSLLSKGWTGIQAAFSSKTYNEITKEKIAKSLNMSVADYEKANGDFYAAKDAKFVEKYPEFAKLNSPSAAAKAFANPETRKLLEQEALAMFSSNDIDAIRQVNKKTNNKKLGAQNRKRNTLNSGFRSKVERFLKDPIVSSHNLNVTEAQRNPFTQFAYFSKGRASNELADYILKLAGFKSGLKYWGGDNSINTKTLGSAHLGGNAIDFSLKNLSQDTIQKIGQTADKYGLEWGGNWKNMYDPPHFQDKSDKSDPTQAFAKGGLVRNPTKINYLEDFGDKVKTRLNPGEMVLTKSQQYSLFNKIKKYEQQEIAGTTTDNAVKLNESPYISNAREDIVMINKVLDIQNKIYQEQTRHNKIAEDFFKLLISLVGGKLNASKGPRIVEQQSSMSDDLMNGAFNNASGL